MNGKYHFWAALTLGTIVYIIIGWINLGNDFPNPFWPFFLDSIIGGLFPDLDRLIGGMGWHRNVIFHSSLLQIGITISYMFTPAYLGFIFFLIFFYIGTGSHLLLDMIAGSCPPEYESIVSRWGYRLGQIRRGKVTGNIVGPPFRISSKHEQKWLLFHTSLLFLMAFLLYLKLQYGIDFDMPVVL